MKQQSPEEEQELFGNFGHSNYMHDSLGGFTRHNAAWKETRVPDVNDPDFNHDEWVAWENAFDQRIVEWTVQSAERYIIK